MIDGIIRDKAGIYSASQDRQTVLIVDDSPVNLRIMVSILEDCGIKALIAQNGVRALQQLERVKPDLILLDVLMPEMDGFELCKRLKENAFTRDIPVIFVTALSETVDKIKGFEAGGVDYLTKPFQPEEVIARVNTQLMIRKLQQQLQAQNDLLADKNALLETQNIMLKERNEQLKQLNVSKDKFFSIIAHDLRNPFSSLLAFTRFAAHKIEDFSRDELQEMIRDMHVSAERLYELLENLLTWSRTQRGVIQYRPTRLDMKQIVDQVVELFESHAERKQITLRNLIQQKVRVYADRDMIDMIVRNLTSNALKFTETGGTVDISVTQNNRDIEIAVTDTGIGISQEDLPKLFQINSKVKCLGTAGEEGTGLGLILCKELLEQNGGSIWAESKEGKGSTFRFKLPRYTQRITTET